MYFIHFEATPDASNSDKDKLGGAFVDCWIDRSSLNDAVQVAQQMIRDCGWIVDDPEVAFEDDLSNYEEDSPHRKYYEQSLIDGEVIVFHTYPSSEVDEDGSSRR